jgi:MFS family permease
VTFPLLHEREFRAFLVLRYLFAFTGSAFATVVGFQTYLITGDPLALGTLGLVEAIPALSLMLFGGHFADRRDRRSIVIATSVVATICAAILAVVTEAGSVTFLWILAVVFIAGVASGFERPAITAFEAQIIPREYAVKGVSYVASASELGMILGPTVGGILAAVIGLAWTYAFIAILLAVSVGCILLISRKPMPEIDESETLVESVLGGWRYVRRTPALLGSMALDLFAVFFGGAMALLPVFATDILHVGAAGLGFMRTAPSIGALLAMLISTRRPPSRRAGAWLIVSVAGFGASMIVFGLSTMFWLSLVALFFAGVTDGVSMVIRSTILRVLSPERLRGRVASVNWVFIGASNELGAFESGVIARIFGTVPAVVGGAVLTLGVVALVAVTVPTLRALDLDTAEPDEAFAPA